MSKNSHRGGLFVLLVGASVVSACEQSVSPHIEHVTLPTHQTWRVTSVQPYPGLEDVELVKFDWPTPQDPHLAFTLAKEGLKPGDPICLDHIQEIDTFWAHPVPEGGCAALAAKTDGK